MPPRKARKSVSKVGSRKRSKYEDHDANESHSRTDDAHQNPQSDISPFSRPIAIEIVPFQGLPPCEIEPVNELGHASPVGYNAATPIDVTLLLTQGSEHEDCGTEAIAQNIHIAISNIVMSVLSEHQNSMHEHSKDAVRVLGQRCASVRKATTDMNDDISVDRSQTENRHAPVTTGNVSVVEFSQGCCPDPPLPHLSSSACVQNACDQLQQLQLMEPIHNNIILIEESADECDHTNCSPDLPLAHFSSSACAFNACDHIKQLEPIQNKILIEKSGDESSHSAKSNMSLNFTEMMKVFDNDDEDDCSSRRETTVKTIVETVEGYTVRKELAATLQRLIAKYGDIAAKCSFQYEKSRLFFLEQTCEIVEQLQALELTKVTLPQLESMLAFVFDAEHVIDVKWLKKRLNDIMEAKSITIQSRPLKEEKLKSKQGIEEMQKGIEEKKRAIKVLQEELKKNEENLAALKEETRIINGKCLEATGKLKRFYNRRLGHDLL